MDSVAHVVTPARSLVGAALIVLTFAAATAWLFVWPPTSEPTRADAIVVFGARSRPERLPEGLRLAREGVATALVLLAPPEDRTVCRSRARFEVICLRPEPFTTRGDARAVGELAAERGWRSLLLVTSAYHLTRSRLLLQRCFDGSVDGHVADPHDSFERTVRQIAHEWAGLAKALVLDRGC